MLCCIEGIFRNHDSYFAVDTIDLALWCFANISCAITGIKLIYTNPLFYKFIRLIKKDPPPANSTQRLLIWTLANMLRDADFQKIFLENNLLDYLIPMHRTKGEIRQQVFRCLTRFAFGNYEHSKILYEKNVLELVENIGWETHEKKIRSGVSFPGVFYKSEDDDAPSLERGSLLIAELAFNDPGWTVEIIQKPPIFNFLLAGLQSFRNLVMKDWKRSLWNILKVVELICKSPSDCAKLQEERVCELMHEIASLKCTSPFELTTRSIAYSLACSDKWKGHVFHALGLDVNRFPNREDIPRAMELTIGFNDVQITLSASQISFAEQVISTLNANYSELCKERGEAAVVKIIEDALCPGSPFEQEANVTKYISLRLILGPTFPSQVRIKLIFLMTKFPWATKLLQNPFNLEEDQLLDALFAEAKHKLSNTDAPQSTKRRKVDSLDNQ